ncbi:MAG: hypothetical protein ACREOF_20970, partial [Gemmatimonadales bacterium]
MRELLNGIVLASIALTGAIAPDVTRPDATPQAAPDLPPPASLQGDPADSLYRAARAALQDRSYRRAADLFAALTAKHPKSGYAGDALYWQAFSLYRLGNDEQLRQALKVLATQRTRYPKAATRGDAAALERRIQGELAQRGDPAAAEAIARAAEALGTPPTPPTPPT